MENFNISEFMEQVERELNEKASSIEEKQVKLMEVGQMLQKMEQILFKLFEQKAELEKELKAFEEQQQKDNARHESFINFFEGQMNEDSKK
jgi:septal ring factor EnvC (AmiA/AmiB activator)